MRGKILLGVSALLMVAALYMVFIYVPTEQEMGVVQRIFYFHVPVAWVAFLAFFVVFLSSILYLWKRQNKWDFIASSSAELGILFTTLVLITGPIWAKAAWGIWWTWDARLTTTLVLWLIYVAYFIIRSYVAEEERRARFAAVIGIIGFVDVPIVAMAINLWGTQHPPALIFEGGLTSLPGALPTLLVSIAAFTTLYFLLLWQRVKIKHDESELRKLKAYDS